MRFRVFGCVLLILGTSIGAGMLALPVALAQTNIMVTLSMLLMSWAAMTLGALSILEVNLTLPAGCNLISMAGKTLGRTGQTITWLFYLILLYGLLAAYLSGVGDIVEHTACQLGLCWSRSGGTILALVILAGIVYCGLGSVDGLNRLLMSCKLLLLALLVCVVFTHFSTHLIQQGQYHLSANMILVVLTSFGFAIIVPSLRGYLNSDAVKLKKVITIGSLLPLIIYTVWVVAIQGVIPRLGAQGLIAMSHSNKVNSLMMSKVASVVALPWLAQAAKLFVSICVLTSFLGVSICQIDFIADGLQMKKRGWSAVVVYAAAYLPPLVLVLIWPGLFIKALSYAGICCVVILILMPLSMLYVTRYHKSCQVKKIVPGGRWLIMLGLAFGLAVLGIFIGQLFV